MNRSRHGWALGLAAALACGNDKDVVHAGEHVTLIVDPTLDTCGDLVGHMDRFVELTAEFLGVDLEDKQFLYYWFSNERFVATGVCSPGVVGCAAGNRSASYAAPLDHELAHVIFNGIGTPPSFFAEGAGVAFELPTFELSLDKSLPGDDDLLEILAKPGKIGAEHYTLAGGFTRFLIDRHGLDAYLAYFADLVDNREMWQIEVVHAARFHESLAATITAFDAERRDCEQRRFRLKLFECSAPTLDWDGVSLSLHRSLSCEVDDVVGPFEDFTARAFFTIEVAEPGLFAVTLASDEERTTAALGNCGGCDSEGHTLLIAGDEAQQVWLPTGRYYVALSSDVEAETTVALRLARIDAP